MKAYSSFTVKHIMLFMKDVKYGQFTIYEELNKSASIVSQPYGEEVCIY